MKQKISQLIERSIELPAGLEFNRDKDGTIIHQDDGEDDTMFYVYIQSKENPTLYDGLMFSKYWNPVGILEKIKRIAEELKGRI